MCNRQATDKEQHFGLVTFPLSMIRKLFSSVYMNKTRTHNARNQMVASQHASCSENFHLNRILLVT